MTEHPATTRTVEDLRKRVARWRASGETVALVPTMGALHDGHLSLVKLARKKADRTVVSIFVNPAQFAPTEDLESYPRDEARDGKLLAALGVDLIYAPSVAGMYAEDFTTRIAVGGLSEGLCGASRPHFFSGVATVVAKLLNQCRPDVAFFGEKDYQQFLVIRRMARDLDMAVEIAGGPVVREADGLAMSSRNAYLTAEERKIAPLLHRMIDGIAEALAKGETAGEATARGRAELTQSGFEVDYLEVRNAETLAPIEGRVREHARVFAAAMLGRTRLIDNVPVPGA